MDYSHIDLDFWVFLGLDSVRWIYRQFIRPKVKAKVLAGDGCPNLDPQAGWFHFQTSAQDSQSEQIPRLRPRDDLDFWERMGEHLWGKGIFNKKIIGYSSDSHHSLFAISLKRADDLTALITNAETINW